MGETTGIGWTDATQNFWRGCERVSPGCAHCYMYRDQLRYGRDPSVVVRAADATFHAPLRWKEPRLIFTCSWSDFFIEEADSWRDDAWDIIRRTPRHTWQILTKRPELVADRLPPDWGDGWPHVWLGVSVENRRFVDRARALIEIPARTRFVSAEPLLGELEGFGRVLAPLNGPGNGPRTWRPAISWVIVGGESGPEARLMELDWARHIVQDCRALRVAVFVKQLGERWARDTRARSRKGEDPAEWPEDLRVQEFPEAAE